MAHVISNAIKARMKTYHIRVVIFDMPLSFSRLTKMYAKAKKKQRNPNNRNLNESEGTLALRNPMKPYETLTKP